MKTNLAAVNVADIARRNHLRCFALELTGDALLPRHAPGDILIVDTAHYAGQRRRKTRPISGIAPIPSSAREPGSGTTAIRYPVFSAPEANPKPTSVT